MIPATEIKWARFRPDLSDYSPEFSDAIMNVEPKPDGYGPLPSFSQLGSGVLQTEGLDTLLTEDGEDIELDGFLLVSEGITEACYGAINVRLQGAQSAIYAGTVEGLYRLSSAGGGWTDVTRVDGSLVKLPYNLVETSWWAMAQFGSRLIACNGIDATQFVDVDSGTLFAALPNAPIAKAVDVVGDFLVFGNLSTNDAAIQWSAVNNSEDYVNGGSDIQAFADGGPVQGIIGHQGGAIIFQRDKIRIMEWRGDDLVFGFRVIQEGVGCYAPRSIARARNTFFWYDQGGFYEGANANPIGDDRVNKTVTETFTAGERQRLRAAVDPVRNIVWWIGTKPDGTTHMFGYDYLIGEWTQSNAQIDFAFPAIKPGYSIDDIGEMGYTFDTIPYPLDSDEWRGNAELVLAGFTEDGTFGYFEGRPQACTLETTDIELNPGQEVFLQSARLVSDIDNLAQTGQVGTRPYQGADITWSTAVAPSTTTGTYWFRKRGRTHRIRINVEADDWNNTTGVTVYASAAGGR
jgi:hypothetical protein